VDADIAKRAGAFNPSAAEWNEFESLPGFAAAKSDIRKLLQVMGARAHELANTGEVIKHSGFRPESPTSRVFTLAPQTQKCSPSEVTRPP